MVGAVIYIEAQKKSPKELQIQCDDDFLVCINLICRFFDKENPDKCKAGCLKTIKDCLKGR